jgi:endonuclease/exonuclease/phosphatase family metal-dependent hydrolase
MIFMGRQIFLAAVIGLIVAASCMAAGAEVVTDSPGCSGIDQGRVVVADHVILWRNEVDASDQDVLRSWCEAVGSPVFMTRAGSSGKINSADTLIVVSWNTHAGAAELSRFVLDLRSGRFTHGKPVNHFVLLLQEVFRERSKAKGMTPANTETGANVRPTQTEGRRVDIVETAIQKRLGVLYVPSMRNSGPDDDALAEDRGNAILSTLPLASPMAVELPLERQRRVAIAANVSGWSTSGTPWTIQLVNVHLENRARWGRVFRTFGRARLNQIAALLRGLPVETPSVLAGDFNTWFRGTKEPAIHYVREIFDQPSNLSEQGTVRFGSLLPERITDYVLFRVPDHWQVSYHRADELYGSDHYPLIGLLHMGK